MIQSLYMFMYSLLLESEESLSREHDSNEQVKVSYRGPLVMKAHVTFLSHLLS